MFNLSPIHDSAHDLTSFLTFSNTTQDTFIQHYQLYVPKELVYDPAQLVKLPTLA